MKKNQQLGTASAAGGSNQSGAPGMLRTDIMQFGSSNVAQRKILTAA